MEIFEIEVCIIPRIMEILEIWFSHMFCNFLPKKRAPKLRTEPLGFRGEIPHIRPIQNQNPKLFEFILYKAFLAKKP